MAVTGTFNGQPVVLDNAATEATLKRLIDAVNGMKSGMPGAPGSATDPAVSAGKFDKAVDVASKGVSKSADLFQRSFTNTTPGIKDFSGVLAEIATAKGAGSVINAFGGTLDDNIQIFRNLSAAGIDLGDSILQAQLAASDARLPLDIFAKTIKENAVSMSAAFGGATAGAAKFAEMSGKVMATAGKDLAKLGFSMDEISEYSASYIEQMQRSGRAQTMSTNQLAEGAIRYNVELDKMAKATGISRQQLDEANKAAQRDARMRLTLSKLSEQDQVAVTAKIEQLKKLDPTGKLAAGFQDLIAGGGVAMTKEARMFTLAMQQSGVDAGKMARDIYNGQKGAVEGMNASLTKAAKASSDLGEGQRRLTTSTMTLGVETPLQYRAMIAGLGDSTKQYQTATAEQAKKLASTDPTRSAAGLDQTLTEVQNSFKKSFIETGVLNATADGMTAAAKGATALADGFAKMNTAEKLGTVLAASLAKQVLDYLVSPAGIASLGAGYGAKKYIDTKLNKPDVDAGKLKTPGAPVDGKDAGKVGLKTVAKEAGEAALKRLKVAILTIGGVSYLVREFDVGSNLVESLGLNREGPERLTIDQEAVRDKLPGFEIGKKVEADKTRELKPEVVPVEPKKEEPTEPAKPNAEVEKSKINVESTKKNVQDIQTSLKDLDFAKLNIPDNVANSIDAGSIKLKTLRDNITATTSAFKDLNNADLEKLSANLDKLNESMLKLSGKEPEKKAAKTPKSQEDLLSDVISQLDQLNSTMNSILETQSDALGHLSKTAKNTRQTVGNMLG
jgi:hypothetical protein